MTPLLVEAASGAQVLPPTGDVRATVTSWVAHLCCDADQRRHPEFAAIAARLRINENKETYA